MEGMGKRLEYYTSAVALHGITRSVSSGKWTGAGTDTSEYDFLWQLMSNAEVVAALPGPGSLPEANAGGGADGQRQALSETYR